MMGLGRRWKHIGDINHEEMMFFFFLSFFVVVVVASLVF